MLTVVVAPAGFGRDDAACGLVCARLSASGKYVAWLSLDAETTICTSSALPADRPAEIMRRIGAQSIELIRNDPTVPPKTVLSVLVNEIAEAARDVVIILDDAHLLKSKEVNDAIHRLLTYPPNLHLVLASRGEPYFALSRFRARSQLLRLGSDDLRFGTEARALFATTQGRQFPRDQIGPSCVRPKAGVTGPEVGLDRDERRIGWG